MVSEHMVQKLIILGASGNALDLLDIVEAINRQGPAWEVAGLLDDGRGAGSEWHGVKVLGRFEEARRFAGDCQFVCAVGSEGSHRKRRELLERTGLSSERFATLVHPGASVSARARLSAGCYVGFGVSIAGAVTAGEHVIFGAGCIVGHDAVIEECSILAPAAVVSGAVRVGAGSYVGAGAMVKQRVQIGAGALVGMGAVVVKDVAAGTCVVGNPARVLERRGAAAVTAQVAREPAAR